MKKIRTRDGNSPFRVFKSPKGEKYSKKQNNPVFLNGKDKEEEEGENENWSRGVAEL